MSKKLFLYIKGFSELGSMMDMMIMNTVILSMTNSPTWLSAVLGARVFGGVLSSLIAGVVADRYDRKKLMVISDLLRGTTLVFLLIDPEPIMFLVISFFLGAVFQFLSGQF
ncbi:MFS transporter [Neobacillus ginsengisoli]|uniref:MFS family permease n=1 Tax=Neobacillus ginsengisoli TaxID=904295 RepID=A0ABT9XXI9_9BACI|nr:MFS transporter [Neobacillus ginsengisoli]MDQ0199602.1 MFS family permease [Neobacillus ginsengisoli]